MKKSADRKQNMEHPTSNIEHRTSNNQRQPPRALDRPIRGRYVCSRMSTTVTQRGTPTGPRDGIPPLEPGAHLSASEFLRRYEAMPEVKKAELIGGIVYMASPVRIDQHGEPDNLIQTWLGNYSIATPGVKAAANTTLRLGPDDVPQPDG